MHLSSRLSKNVLIISWIAQKLFNICGVFLFVIWWKILPCVIYYLSFYMSWTLDSSILFLEVTLCPSPALLPLSLPHRNHHPTPYGNESFHEFLSLSTPTPIKHKLYFWSWTLSVILSMHSRSCKPPFFRDAMEWESEWILGAGCLWLTLFDRKNNYRFHRNQWLHICFTNSELLWDAAIECRPGMSAAHTFW